MPKLNNLFPDHGKIRNIIFDFGGVICDLDIKKTEQKFRDFGSQRSIQPLTDKEQSSMWEDLVGKLEIGAITPDEFRKAIRDFYRSSPSDPDIDEAWNALLSDIPDERIKLLEDLRIHYRIFLLSNSNLIHYNFFLKKFQEKTGYKDMDGLFEKAYFSFNLGMRKPMPEIFNLVLKNHALVPDETLFIDDTPEHIEAASKIGIKGYQLKEGVDLLSLFQIEGS